MQLSDKSVHNNKDWVGRQSMRMSLSPGGRWADIIFLHKAARSCSLGWHATSCLISMKKSRSLTEGGKKVS